MRVDDDGEGERLDMAESKDGAVVSRVGRIDEAIAQECTDMHATARVEEGLVRLITQWLLWVCSCSVSFSFHISI
jgi:hypothetical protein